MGRRTGLILAIMGVLLLFMGSASAGASGAAGGFAVENGGTIYFAVSENGRQSLYSAPTAGGQPVLRDQADELGQLVNTPQGVYYLRKQGAPAIVRTDGAILAEFGPNQRVSGLCYDHSALYGLVDGILTRIQMDGTLTPLSERKMEEFVLKGGEVMYASADDRKAYEQHGEERRAGRLYRLELSSGRNELMLDGGVENLKLLGDYLYFHNLEDAYLGADRSSSILAGRLYRMRLSDGTLQAINCDIDLDYFPTDSGLILRTPWEISRCSLSGGDVKQLLAIDQAVSLAVCAGDAAGDALVYMQEEGLLLRVPLNGSRVQAVGRMAEDEEAEASDWAAADEQEYIFPNSDREKLNRAQVEALDPALLGYARNEIYARHGYEFKTRAYAEYFGSKPWYQPGGFSKSDLNSIEWYNMDLIAAVEEAQNQEDTPETAEYIFPNSDKYKLTREQIEQVDPALWPYARNEIYARHGYVFTREKYARYFMEKSWYRPGGFSESSLNSVEWYNMELLSQMESEHAG